MGFPLVRRKGRIRDLLQEDLKIRDYLTKELKQAAISKVVIERPHKKCRVSIHSGRPGLIIGKKGADIEKLRKQAVGHDQFRNPPSTSSKCASRKSTQRWWPRIHRPAA